MGNIALIYVFISRYLIKYDSNQESTTLIQNMMKTSRDRLITISPHPVGAILRSTGVCVHKEKVFSRNGTSLHGTGWRKFRWQWCHLGLELSHTTLSLNSGGWRLCLGARVSGTSCVSISSLKVILPRNVRELWKMTFAASPTPVPLMGLISQVLLTLLSPEGPQDSCKRAPNPRSFSLLRAKQSRAGCQPCSPPGLTPPAPAPSSQGLDVSTQGGVARPRPPPPLMKCGEKMQPAGRLARVQGGKREKFMVKRLSSHGRRKRRHLCIFSG